MSRKNKATTDVYSKPKWQPRKITAKNNHQQEYIDSVRKNIITFAEGAAGTGKTSLAIGLAVEAFNFHLVDKIIITRPILDASDGGSLGALPGTAEEKLHPYIIPVLDELNYYMTFEEIRKLRLSQAIEIIPLELMRGRNFHNTFLVADEMQNATKKQLRLLLTRFGQNSRVVVNGDSTQSDLPQHKQGALVECMWDLEDLSNIGLIEFDRHDIIRHPLLIEIIGKWEQNDIRRAKEEEEKGTLGISLKR